MPGMQNSEQLEMPYMEQIMQLGRDSSMTFEKR